MNPSVLARLRREVIDAGICTGCGACAALAPSGCARMEDTPSGPRPVFAPGTHDLPPLAWDACPGKGIDYPALYLRHYERLPDNWLLGCFQQVRTGYSSDEAIRRGSASGGILSHTLTYLLEQGQIDAAIVVRQGLPEPKQARVTIARSREAILNAAQSVYIPVSVLDILGQLVPGERYAITCLPEQAAALRWLQHAGHPAARQVLYVLGPYTGTALYPAAIDCYLRSKGVRSDDPVTSLKWRAGEWPGYMEIRTASGVVLRSKKVYYNFLIPFFITQTSLQSMDFTNEFCDLSVGDAWSPRFEALGGGHSILTTRSAAMEQTICEMAQKGLLSVAIENPQQSLAMHGHMLDFKKRGGYIRNRLRLRMGRRAPDYGIRPQPLPASRWAVELVIGGLFLLGSTWLARKALEQIPESVIGPLFNRLRLGWKNMSKPVKRKGLGQLTMAVRPCP